MSAVRQWSPLSIEEYLAGELASRVKHEYVNGAVYAMVGARNVHNVIATNAVVALGARLRGKPCRPFNSDTKVRLRLPTEVRFYYPDAMVVCRPNPPHDSFQDEPAVIVEVLSEGTRRLDEGEKKDAYFTIPSLVAYLLVEQDAPAVTVWRRSDRGFIRETLLGLNAAVPLPEVDAELPLAELYEAVEFPPPAE